MLKIHVLFNLWRHWDVYGNTSNGATALPLTRVLAFDKRSKTAVSGYISVKREITLFY